MSGAPDRPASPRPLLPVGGTHADLGSLLDAALGPARSSRNDYYFDYRPVADDEAQAIREQAGIDVGGYVHSVDESAIRHILGGHGEGIESWPESLPVTREDLLRIPEVTAFPDSIRGGKTRRGMDEVRYVKRIDGIIFYVEEVRTGRRKLTAKTMWKNKAGGTTQPSFAQTSETLLPPEQGQRATSQTASPATIIIGATEPEVKTGGGPPARQSPPAERPGRSRPEAERLDASAEPASTAGPSHSSGATTPEVKAGGGPQTPQGPPAEPPAVSTAEPPAHAVEARQVAFAYRKGEPVLRGVSLVGRAGRLLCLLGPNGSGKTTLLRCLLGWLRPAAGGVLLDGRDIRNFSPRQLARLVAYVPQVPQSAFAFSVGEIVLMGRFSHAGLMGLAGEQDLAVAREAMRMTGVLDLADRTLEELSGGQAQCVMIARALAQQPSVLLLDEPTSHLDLKNQLSIHRMMQRLAHDWGMAVVCVSHDVNLAARFADELALLSEGTVVAAGAPAEVIRREVLERTYGVEIDLVAGGGPVPIVVGR